MKKILILFIALVLMVLGVQAQVSSAKLNKGMVQFDESSSFSSPFTLTLRSDSETLSYSMSSDGSYIGPEMPEELTSLIIDKYMIEAILLSTDLKDDDPVTVQYRVYKDGDNGDDVEWKTATSKKVITMVTYTQADDQLAKKVVSVCNDIAIDVAKGLRQGYKYTLEVLAQVATEDNEFYFFPESDKPAVFHFTIAGGILVGDIDGDNLVNTTDVTTLYNVIFGTDTTTDRTLCDLNGDGEINTTDVTVLYNIIFGTATLPEKLENKEFNVNGVTFTMIAVEGGTFQMGSTSGYDDEKPVHSVTLSDYYIGETEVTQALWEAVMGSNPSIFIGNQHPVEFVSWNDCQTFISKLNELTGCTFRLPTEAEWEFAARGGTQSNGYTYSGSNTIDDVAWYSENSFAKGSSDPDYGTHDVATKAANELGIYDMTGNVFEFCQDWYGDYSSDAQTNPTGPTSASERVYRGGSWGNYSNISRVYTRLSGSTTFRDIRVGLRLAL
ncbi:MAG: SUMF1/EgtB/PvdO family nonheme iron enzyme [Prevotella sp.]|nr:SUMF1/EgtB/PvdO family nonheme iron enzyme [Prevotella sp.]